MKLAPENGPKTGKDESELCEISAENIIIEITEESDEHRSEPIDTPQLLTVTIKRESCASSEDGSLLKESLCETINYGETSSEFKAFEASGDDEECISLVEQESTDTNLLEDIPNDVLVYSCRSESQDPLGSFPCKSCSMVSGCIFCLKSHYESVHLNLGLIQYKCDHTTYLKDYTEICHKCNLVCESKQEMIDHRKIHFVSCDVCDMSFDSALFLSNHCKITHEKFEVIISCDLCEQWFKQLQDLSDHYEDYHEMILCIVCFKRFSNREDLINHHGTHKIVLSDVVRSFLPYACSKCNQAFAEICELSAHLVKNHPCQKTTYGDLTKKKGEIGSKAKHKKKKIRFNDCGGLSQDDKIEFDEDVSKRKKKC